MQDLMSSFILVGFYLFQLLYDTRPCFRSWYKSNNDCKGAMMEEWHQKLYNNTSPDDVVICQVLSYHAPIDYIKADFDISIYWKTLNENGITKERLLSYDRAIHSEPHFRRDQKDTMWVNSFCSCNMSKKKPAASSSVPTVATQN